MRSDRYTPPDNNYAKQLRTEAYKINKYFKKKKVC